MAVFTISDNTIDMIRKKDLLRFILTAIIGLIIWGSLSFFAMRNIGIEIEILIISFCLTIILVSLALLFSLKFRFKTQAKEMKSVQYTIENDRLIIKQNDFEQFNISKNEIKCINKYKNNVIIIILNTNKKIIVNKYLDNFDQLIENLNILSPINRIDKNQSIAKNVGINILQIIIVSMILISNNIILVAISGLIAIIYSIVHFYDESIDKKKRILLLVCVLIIVIIQIARLVIEKL